MLRFPELKSRSVFVAAPSDMDYLRASTCEIVSDLKKRTAGYRNVEIYDWRAEVQDRQFADWKAAQEQISTPSDLLCCGVVCMFGERIGTPLLQTVTRDELREHLGVHAEPAADWKYRLVHPWPQQPEDAALAAESGGFALTGTVFECLAALHAQKTRNSAPGQDGNPPILILFIGAGGAAGEDDISDADWGHGRFLDATEARFKQEVKGRKWHDAFQAWRHSEYDPQVVQLGNLLGYLATIADDYKELVSEATAPARIEQFLRTHVIPAPDTIDDSALMKGLESYGEEDADRFFGRQTDRDLAIMRLEQIWREPMPTFFGIVGASGVGKSSFLRAGLIGSLRRRSPDPGRRYHGFAVRPGDLLPTAAEARTAQNPLHALFARALTELSPDAQQTAELERLTPLADLHDQALAAAAVDRLETILRSGNRRLLIGLDQFEEIVDYIADPTNRAFLQPVIDFIAAAARSERIGIVYTLQPNRIDALTADPVMRDLCASGHHLLTLMRDADLDLMVERVFARARVRLVAGFASEFTSRVRRFADKGNVHDPARSSEGQGSLMPLISLALRRIYEVVREHRAAPPRAPDSHSPDAADKAGAHARTETTASQHFNTALAPGDAAAAAAGAQENRVGAGAPGSEAGVEEVLLALERDGASNGPRSSASGAPLVLTVPLHLLDIEEAVADCAERALAQAERNSGPALSEDTLGSFLDRFVRPFRLLENRFNLPVAPLPTDWARRHLALEFVRERLLIPDPGRTERARLVHEAILLHWARAQDWLKSRRTLLAWEENLTNSARTWELEDCPASQLTEEQALKAAGLLARRVEAFSAEEGDGEVALLRRYCLALLAATCTPTREIADTDHGTLHIEVAALHGAADLVQRYLAAEPHAAQAQRRDSRTSLFAACIGGSETVARLLIDAGARIDQTDENGWQPIHFAAHFGSLDILRILMEHGASASAAGSANRTPLHLATTNGQSHVVEYLLSTPGVSPEDADNDGSTALHNAVSLRNEVMVHLLLRHGARPDPVDLKENTPLHFAAGNGHAGIAALLLAKGADPARKKDQHTPLRIAAELGHDAFVDALLTAAPEHARTSVSAAALHAAAASGHADAVRVLAGHGADANARMDEERTALHVAAEKGHIQVVRALKGHADVEALDSKRRWPLRTALAAGQFDVARVLKEELKASTEHPRDGGWALLHLAARRGDEQQVGILLEMGADPNVRGPDGSTPLHLVSETGHDAIAQMLLSHPDIEPSACEDDGTTPLHVAASRGNTSVAALLLKHAATLLQAVDDYGWTPLHVAAQAGSTAIVRMLLDAGAPVNDDADRSAPLTPLQAAAEAGNEHVVALLVDRGADLDAFTADKAAPVVLAIRQSCYPVALQLLDAGARVPAQTATLVDLIVAHRLLRAGAEDAHAWAAAQVTRRLLGGGIEIAIDVQEVKRPGATEPHGSRKGADTALGYTWTPADAALRASLVPRLDPIDAVLPVDDSAEIVVTALPWYRDIRLVRVTSGAWPVRGLAIYFLLGEERLVRIEGKSPPIHQVNESAPIMLDEDNVLAYLRFFCFFVHGDHGPFHIAEDIDDPVLPKALDHPTQVAIWNSLRPATYEGRDEQGRFLCDATVFYSNALFNASFAIEPGGMVEMLDDEPIAADLPVHIELAIRYEPDPSGD